MVNSRSEYSEHATAAARMVLLELVRILGSYRDSLVLVGGWVPELLFSKAQPRHVGSTDVDMALNHRTISEEHYRSILQSLLRHGYVQGEQPFMFFRKVALGSSTVNVQVDFLAGEYGGSTKRHRHQAVQELKARKARGCDLAFEMAQSVKIEGILPEGAKDSAEVRVAGVVPFLVMKAMALADRMKPKDAWDIYFCLLNYAGGTQALAKAFRPHLKNKLVLEGLGKIRDKFASAEHVGAKWCADFDEINDLTDREIRMRDAFERVNDLLSRLGLVK